MPRGSRGRPSAAATGGGDVGEVGRGMTSVHELHSGLMARFGVLRGARGERPVYFLEHGLDELALEDLVAAVSSECRRSPLWSPVSLRMKGSETKIRRASPAKLTTVRLSIPGIIAATALLSL